uniref:Uncharacterized protein n=1 Tax=Steinernema glaseri TaxID=37863 RepID=A0A1I7YIT2_9BILA
MRKNNDMRVIWSEEGEGVVALSSSGRSGLAELTLIGSVVSGREDAPSSYQTMYTVLVGSARQLRKRRCCST